MTPIPKVVIVIAALAAFAPAAYAGDQGDPDKDCDGSTQEMVECLATQTMQWDKRMNAAYEKAMKNAEARQHDQLRAAQRLWVQYRDANCLFYELGEGTIARLNSNSCMLRLTEERARELENLEPQ
jgi:uncharacterized protein YecT (DUF1311 family)